MKALITLCLVASIQKIRKRYSPFQLGYENSEMIDPASSQSLTLPHTF
jgi:hypothetical protein